MLENNNAETQEVRTMKKNNRVVITNVTPEIDAGRFPIKRVVGEMVAVEADIFADGHDVLSASLLYKDEGKDLWEEAPMARKENDRWAASFIATTVGNMVYTVKAWVNPFRTWKRNFLVKMEAGQDIGVELKIGKEFYERASLLSGFKKLPPDIAGEWKKAKSRDLKKDDVLFLMRDEWGPLMDEMTSSNKPSVYPNELRVVVDRERALFGSWYEVFPRSTAGRGPHHGSFKDLENFLPYVSSMGFDVAYLPPIHPIGEVNRKGKNNNVVAQKGDVGSPWAIGSKEGGHKAIYSRLGGFPDFQSLLKKAKTLGLELALDLAFQCSPDHPYIKEHPSWFRHRPDGTIQYAENPPKKYEDIVPFDFETDDWESLWDELKSVVDFWIEKGVRIFRVDNPHTKPLAFWEWLITGVKKKYPETIFLSEAFTRPPVMKQLAKAGFTQSYNYFPWRNTKRELVEYFTELTRSESREYFRPNLWPNTPDILTEYLQAGGRPAFMARFILAATLGPSYGIYGPAYELCEDRAKEKGSEEYLNSEKYELKNWDVSNPKSLQRLITRVNAIRRANPALRTNCDLQFLEIQNDNLLCFTKQTQDKENQLLIVVNLDPHHVQSGWMRLPASPYDLPYVGAYRVHDLLTDIGYLWHGEWNYIELNPQNIPAHIFRIERLT